MCNTPTNTVHFACFDCRCAFKQPGSSNWDARISERPYTCPNCQQPMTRLGRYFKAPPKRAVRQWLNVELLHAFGERFESGSSGVGRSCTTLALTVRHLADGGHAEAEVRRKLEAIRKLRAAR